MISEAIAADMFEKSYAEVFAGDERWAALDVPLGERYEWGTTSTYVRQPPFFDGMPHEPAPLPDIHGARALAKLGGSVTTDHISPAGNIRKDGPAGSWLVEHGVAPVDFNSYGSRRGNHEVMVRGTFANVRLRNQLAPGTEGGFTTFFPTGEQTTIYDAAMRYAAAGTPLVVLAGKEYGSGSSRDWAAKGTTLLGVRAVLAESFERIHRSNLIGMGVLPLQYLPGESAESLGLTGEEVFDITGLEAAAPSARSATADRHGRWQDLRRGAAHRYPGRGRVLPPRGHPALRAAPAPPARLSRQVRSQAGRRGPDGALYPFTAPEVRPDTTALRKTSTRMAMGTTATTLAAKSVPYGTVNWEPNSAIPTGMVR